MGTTRFVKAQRETVTRPDLKAADVRTLLLGQRATWATPATTAHLEAVLGRSRATVTRSLNRLLGLGLATVSTDGTRTGWQVTIPETGWVRLPVAWAETLTDSALRVLAAAVCVSWWSEWERRHRFTVRSFRALAQILGVSHQTVSRAFAEAIEAGAIEAPIDGYYTLPEVLQVETWGRLARGPSEHRPEASSGPSAQREADPYARGRVSSPDQPRPSDAAPSPGAGERAGAAQPSEPPAPPAMPPLRRCSGECHGLHELGRWTRASGSCPHCGSPLVELVLERAAEAAA